MILLDTNVVSDVSKPTPNPRVQAWLDAQDQRALWISSITVAEICAGLATLPEGQRRSHLEGAFDHMMLRLGRACLAFDALAGREYAAVMVARRRRGRPIGILDAQIAAIALATGFRLATLNTRDFEGIDGLSVVDPSQA